MSARNLRVGTILDTLAWVGDGLAALRTPRGSPQRRAKLEEIGAATTKARIAAESYRGRFAPEVRVALQVAELGVQRARSGWGSPESPGAAHDSRERPRRVHPRHAVAAKSRT